jgi:DNA sulfur modification protein DndE
MRAKAVQKSKEDIIGKMNYFTRIRVGKDATNKLSALKSKTGLTPNLLCRIALCYSLENEKVSNLIPPDETGQEFNRHTLFGDNDLLFISLVKQRCIKDGLDPNKDMVRILKLHLNSGIIAINSRIKEVTDFINLLENE